MAKDNRTLDVLQAGTGKIPRIKRPGDKFIYDVPCDKFLGPEGKLNAVLIDSVTTGPGSHGMVAVAQVSATEAWAVGSYINANGVSQNMAQHTTDSGTTWTKTTPPNKQNSGVDTNNYITCVTAFSASEVYAAGYYVNGSGTKTPFCLLWNGTAWAFTATAPAPGSGDAVPAGIAIGATANPVIVGNVAGDGTGGSTVGFNYIFASHSTDSGATWATVWNDGTNLPPAVSSTQNFVTGIYKAGAAVFYACGYYNLASNSAEQNLIIKSTNSGGTWVVNSTIPNVTGSGGATRNNRLTGISGTNSIMAVCGYGPDVNDREVAYIYTSATGASWVATTVPTPQGTGTNRFLGIANNAVDYTCVGYYVDSTGAQKGMVQKYNVSGATWTVETIGALGTGQEVFSAVASFTVAGTPNNYYITAVGQSAGLSIVQHNAYDGNTPNNTFTSQTPDSTMVPGVTPPTIVLGTIDSTTKQTFPVTVSGGTSGWKGAWRIKCLVTFPRGTANLVANGYIRFINLYMEVI